DALGALANAPAMVGEVMHDVFWQWLYRIGVKDGEISRHARAYEPAVINTKGRGRDKRNLAYGLLQRQNLLLTHPIAEQAGAKPHTAVELHVCPTVREPDDGIGTRQQGRHGLGIDVDLAENKDRIQVFGHGQIEERVKRILALGRSDLGDVFTFECLVLW